MHTAGGSRGRYVLSWHELAQRDDNLRAAFRVVFGKRLPTPQKLGQWLSERMGAHGGYLLEGKHPRKRGGWAYRVLSLAEVAEQDRKRRELEAAQLAEIQRKQREAEAALQEAKEKAAAAQRAYVESQTAAAREKRAAFEARTPQFEYTEKVNSEGRIVRTLVTGRDGKPIEKKEAPMAAEPEPTPEPEQTAPASKRDNFPVWIREGRQPTRAEWEAHQRQRNPSQTEVIEVSHARLGPEWFFGGALPGNDLAPGPVRRWSQDL